MNSWHDRRRKDIVVGIAMRLSSTESRRNIIGLLRLRDSKISDSKKQFKKKVNPS